MMICICAAILMSHVSWAVEAERPQPQLTPAPPSVPSSVLVAPSSTDRPVGQHKKSKGKIAREKDAEGTKAPNRFNAETIIKSKYELNGQSLEVDTD